MNALSEEQIKILNKIHELALNNDHLLVLYKTDKLAMANAVIENCHTKLCQIAELVQVVCGD